MKDEMITQKTVVSQVMEDMKEMISTGKYKPGDKIPTEEELSQIFGVGRSSIREAVKIFNYLGILESVTGIGTHVCASVNLTRQALSWAIILRKKEPIELLELRNVIEQQSLIGLTKKYAGDPSSVSEIITTLESILLDLKSMVENQRKQQIIEKDYLFHSTIIQGSKNSVFLSVWEALKYFLLDEIDLVESLYPSRDIVSEHQDILNAIKTGDIEKVSEVHKEHLDDIRNKLKRITKDKDTYQTIEH